MPKALLLNIPEPCHENWHNMTPNEQGRFCGSCQKTVVDFTVMTDKEILDYFSKASQHVCGHFAGDQLNKEITAAPTKKRVTWLYVWNLVLASLLMTKTYAQGKPQVRKPPVKTIAIKTIVIENPMVDGWVNVVQDPAESVIPVNMMGVVLDLQTNQPVSGASVYIKGTENGTNADSTGKFLLCAVKKNALELEFSAIGYETQMVLLDKTTNWNNVRVLLKPAFNELETATVIGYGTKKGRVMACDVRVKTTKLEKIQQVISDYTPAALKKDIKIYPNPVKRGNNIQLKLNLPQAGEYKLELLNTAGQIMLIQPLLMQTKEQLVDLYTQRQWSEGLYWVRISSPKMKTVVEARVLLQ